MVRSPCNEFRSCVNRLAPHLLDSVDPGLLDYILMESEGSDVFWREPWDEFIEGEFEEWWPEDPQRAVMKALAYWIESVKKCLLGALEPEGIVLQYLFELRHDDPEGERKRIQAQVQKLRITVAKTNIRLFIDAVSLDPKNAELPSLLLQGVITAYGSANEGRLIQAVVARWQRLVELLKDDWKRAYTIPAIKWEEIIAGGFELDGYDVILTPRSGDHGRDVIATKIGVGSIKIIGSVKAYNPKHLVSYDDVRALVGVLHCDLSASKAILTTTSFFAPGIKNDPLLCPLIPTRLELMDCTRLREWLEDLALGSARKRKS
jgi:restriction system protein